MSKPLGPNALADAREDARWHREQDAQEEARKAAERCATPPAPRRKALEQQFVTLKTLDQVVERLGEAIGENLAMRDERIKELEARKTLYDAGIWRAAKSYDAGAVVSHSGSGWAAVSRSQGIRPGDGSKGIWRLLVKKGRDAK